MSEPNDPTPDPDRALVQEAQAGREPAMEQLFRRHLGSIYAYALRSTGDPSLAEDIAQETFIRAFRAIRSFDQRSSFRTWLFSIAINRTRTQQKKQKSPALPLEETQLAAEPDPAPSPWARKRLLVAIHALPEGYREAVIMHDVLEMEHEEIAQIRGCTVGTSKSQLHKARAKLRALLGPREETTDA